MGTINGIKITKQIKEQAMICMVKDNKELNQQFLLSGTKEANEALRDIWNVTKEYFPEQIAEYISRSILILDEDNNSKDKKKENIWIKKI